MSKEQARNERAIDQLARSALGVIRKSGNTGINAKQLALKMGLRDKAQRQVLYEAIDGLVQKGKVKSGKKGRLSAAERGKEMAGTLEMITSGAAFVRMDGGGRDVYVRAEHTGTAFHGDRVNIKLVGKRGGGRPEGKVVDVLERRRSQYVGTVRREGGRYLLVPDDQRIHRDPLLLAAPGVDLKEGQKVIAELVQWRSFHDMPEVRAVRVLGKAGEHEVEIHAILAEYDLPLEYPKEVEAAAAGIQNGATKEEIARRRDMREITTFTIDPDDAKDLDDALSIRRLENGRWEVGVHIADVTHYVKSGSIIDKEGSARATSIYLVDRVVPMLPEHLSNDLCSLNPHTDKLCFSAVLELDEQANVKKEWFGRTVINSRHRFAYEEAFEVIQGAKHELGSEVRTLDGLAKQLRTRRIAAGALEIVGNEVKFILGPKGEPLEVKEKVMTDANFLIEEFMLLANRTVAAWVGKVKKGVAHRPFVYRIHDSPDPEKVQQLKSLAKSFGHQLVVKKDEELSHAINRLLVAIRGTHEADILRQVIIRTMAKAIYSTDNIGHYGLGFDHYTHFTSPIRRYPDMMVHRGLAHYLNGGAPLNEQELELNCRHSSMMEKRASDAERASVRFKQAEYLLARIGEVFSGVINSITSWGMYVTLYNNHCEGMISLRDIPGDHYYFDEDKFRVIGQRHGHIYKLGDEVEVRVRAVDMARRQVDLRLTVTER